MYLTFKSKESLTWAHWNTAICAADSHPLLRAGQNFSWFILFGLAQLIPRLVGSASYYGCGTVILAGPQSIGKKALYSLERSDILSIFGTDPCSYFHVHL